jgi:hemolysin activation/secretion protein
LDNQPASVTRFEAPCQHRALPRGALTEGDTRGLGGETTIRGYRQDRFVGPIEAVGNLELRWTFVHFSLLKQRFSLQIAPLYDVGRVFDRGGFSSSNWKWSAGGGLRVGCADAVGATVSAELL